MHTTVGGWVGPAVSKTNKHSSKTLFQKCHTLSALRIKKGHVATLLPPLLPPAFQMSDRDGQTLLCFRATGRGGRQERKAAANGEEKKGGWVGARGLRRDGIDAESRKDFFPF